MTIYRTRLIGALTGALALAASGLGSPQTARGDERAATPAQQAATALHLLEGARYGEAIPAAQALVDLAPNDAVSYQIRGAVGLYVGHLQAARADFQAAAVLSKDNAATQYGQVLCDLLGRHVDDAQTHLTQFRSALGLTPAQTGDVETLRAYLQYLHGDLSGAQSRVGTEPVAGDPVRREMQALIAAHTQPAQGVVLLTAFLQTPSGVPRVMEDEGVRPLFEAAPAAEPSVTEPGLQAMYRASLTEALARATRQAKAAAHLSGDVSLTPPSAGNTAVVTYSVDGQLAGMVNTAPFQYTWHTTEAGNGWHTVRAEALDAGGNILSSTSRRVLVLNQNGGTAVGAGLVGDADLETRVWNVLRLRPSRKVAEWTLANLLDAQRDHAGAGAHRVVTAALDANYKDARRLAQALFTSAAPPSVRAASLQPQGLYQGNRSRKQVALTFDDGPNPQRTPALLDALDQANASATFFVVGARAEAAPDLVRRMAARGDDVENHSYTHPNMAQSAPAVAEAEILRTSVVIHALTGRQPHFFRPPGGNRNPVVFRLAREYGQAVGLWTVDAFNYEESASPQGLINYVVGHVQPGCIVLMHNGMVNTTAAVPGLVAALRAKGYEIVTLSQMTSITSPPTSAKAASLTPHRPKAE